MGGITKHIGWLWDVWVAWWQVPGPSSPPIIPARKFVKYKNIPNRKHKSKSVTAILKLFFFLSFKKKEKNYELVLMAQPKGRAPEGL